MSSVLKNRQYYKFSFYGFLKNLRFFDAFFVLFLIEKGLSYTEIGSLYAAREIVINVFEVPSGIIADTYGRKNSLLGSLLLYIVSFYLYYAAEAYVVFLLAFVLYGMGDAFRSGTHKGMIMDYLRIHHRENQKIQYYGYTRSWSQKGSALSSLIAGLLVFYNGSYQNIFLFSIVPYLINFLLILSYPKELNYSTKSGTSQQRLSVAETVKALFRIFKQPGVLKIVNTSALHTAFLKAIKDYIQPVMIHVALIVPVLMSYPEDKKSGLIIGIIYFILYLLTSAASRYASFFAEKKGKNIPRLTLITGFSLGVMSGIFYDYGLWVLALLSFAGIYLIENIRKPVLTGYISDEVPNELLTSVISVQSLWRTIITAVLALGFGVIADHSGMGAGLATVSLLLLGLGLILGKNST